MLIEATQQPIRYRLQSGVEVLLRPGVPTELTDEAARQLVKKAGSKVRVVEPVQQVGLHVHVGDLIAWQRAGIEQRGTVDFLHRDPDGQAWAFVTMLDVPWCAVNVKFATVLDRET